jgi:hypothetical protein
VLVAEGLSATQIAFRLNAEFRTTRTRHSVIGKIDRSNSGLGKLTSRKAAAKPVNTKPAPSAKPRAGKVGASSPHTKAPAAHSDASCILYVSPPCVGFSVPKRPVPVENLPAPLPVAFIDALFADTCLHFVGNPLSAGGPDMPVCGAARMQDAPLHNRYCRRHFHSQHQVRAA